MFRDTQYRVKKFGVWKTLRYFGLDFVKTRSVTNRVISLNEVLMTCIIVIWVFQRDKFHMIH